MRALITGGAGYIGSALTERLLAVGHRVTVLDRLIFGLPFKSSRPGLEVYRGDVRDPEAIARLLPGHDVVVHLAFASNDPEFRLDPLQAHAVNVAPLGPLVQKANDSGVDRFIFLSSCSVYGAAVHGVIDEAGCTNPLTDYARHKLIGESIVSTLADQSIAITTLRSATVCGRSPRQRFDLLLNRMMAEAVIKRHIRATNVTAKRPCVTLPWLLDAIVHVLMCDRDEVRSKIFNVATETRSIGQWADFVQSLTDCTVDYQTALPADARNYDVSADRILATGFQSSHRLPSVMLELYEAISGGAFKDPLQAKEFHNLLVQEEEDFSFIPPIERVL